MIMLMGINGLGVPGRRLASVGFTGAFRFLGPGKFSGPSLHSLHRRWLARRYRRISS